MTGSLPCLIAPLRSGSEHWKNRKRVILDCGGMLCTKDSPNIGARPIFPTRRTCRPNRVLEMLLLPDSSGQAKGVLGLRC